MTGKGQVYFVFQSTPSARRATRPAQGKCAGWCISIHALREEGDLQLLLVRADDIISIHALREEGEVPSSR